MSKRVTKPSKPVSRENMETIMQEQAQPPVCFDLPKQIQFLRKMGEQTWKQFLSEDRLMTLFLDEPESAARKIQRAWSLYHCAKTSLQFGQAQRGVWYLAAFHRYCEAELSGSELDDAQANLIAWLE